jgi:hypothetical protein
MPENIYPLTFWIEEKGFFVTRTGLATMEDWVSGELVDIPEAGTLPSIE